MKVRALKTCFVDGSLRKAGAVFEYLGEPDTTLECAETTAPVVVSSPPAHEGPTKKELQAQLEAAGVKYAVNDIKDELIAALNAAKAKAAPAASTAPDKQYV